jgi:hypothetical protein
MNVFTQTQRRKSHRKPADRSLIHIETKDPAGNSNWVTADLVDVMGGGCGLALMTLLKSGSAVVVRGVLDESRRADHLKAWVRWCVGRTDGTFRAGLEFLESREESHPAGLDSVDLYEAMQLSPNADADTISRVYRMLAFRYHPDNAETGNSERFIRLSSAHQILSDPQKRATYDARRKAAVRGPLMSLNQGVAFNRDECEQRTLERVRSAYMRVITLECAQTESCWEG